MIASIAGIGAAAAMFMAAFRLLGGPSLQDRVLAANALVLFCVLLCAAAGVLLRAVGALDAALAPVLACYIVNVALLKFFRIGTFQAPMTQARERD